MQRRIVLMSVAILLTVGLAARAEGEGKPRPKSLSGVVSKVDASSITIAQRGEGGERSTAFAIGAQTKILIQTDEDAIVKGEGGTERKIPKTKEAKITDLKADQRVTVTFVEVGKADSVLVQRPAPVRKGGEGDK